MAKDQVKRSSYRYDLDGLRGVAIAFVVIFHIFVGRVSGGVDVFLLLSGFFFLGAQLRYSERDGASLNPWWPLWRTIRRLVPALVLVLGTTVLVVMAFVPSMERMDLARQLVASLLYRQNWELAHQGAAYGAATDAVSPLQHLWSMSVQGQFYLFAILLGCTIVALRRFLPHLSAATVAVPVLAVLTSASFVYALVMRFTDQALNYYSTFSRFWELGLGGLLVILIPQITLHPRVRELATLVGVFMVLTTGLLMDGATEFPGPAALYPLLGATLVVLGDGRVAAMLASRVMRWLGDVAYPLYLWHWPILVVSMAMLDMAEPTWWLGIIVVVVSLILADLTHRGVEKPLQQHAKRPLRWDHRFADTVKALRTGSTERWRAVAGLAVVALSLAMVQLPAQLHNRVQDTQNIELDPTVYPGALALTGTPVPSAESQPDPYLLADTVSPAWAAGCMSTFEDSPDELPIDRYDDDRCVFGDPDAELEVYLVGGSHAEQWSAPLDELGRTYGFRVTPIVRQSCPSYAIDLDGIFGDGCGEFNVQMLRRIEEVQPDLVISTSTRPLLELGSLLDEVPASYLTFWDFLQERGIPFLGLRDNPWFINPDGMDRMVSLCMIEEEDEEICGILREHVYSPEDPAAEELAWREGMLAVDTSSWFCPGDFCPPVIGNIYVYRDGNHLSDEYSRSLSPFILQYLREMLPI